MKIRRFILLSTLFVFIIALFVPSVQATWKFTNESPSDEKASLEIGVGAFIWDGSEDLPDSVEGEDHVWLILNIVEGVDSKGKEIGLNNPDSVINDRINDRLSGGIGWRDGRDYFGSMAATGGDEVSELFDASTNGLSFIVRVENELEYYIYTTSVYLGERGEINFWGNNKTPGKPTIPIGEWIYPVYETKLVRPNKNSDFEIVETRRGRAKSDWYDENRSNANATQIPAFDASTFVAYEMGHDTTNDQAIWTFVGDDPTAYATKSNPELYYRIKPTSAGNRTIWTNNEDAKITIFTSDVNNPIAVSGDKVLQSDGTYRVTVSWNASANTQYYIEITGDDVMQFHVT